MLGTVLRAFILSHLVLTVGSTFIPILQNWKLRHRKDKDLPRSPGGGVAEPGREPQLTDPRVCALAQEQGLLFGPPRGVTAMNCVKGVFPREVWGPLWPCFTFSPPPRRPMGVWSQSPGSLPCQSAGTILGTLIGTAWNVAWQCQPLSELMTISRPTCWLSLFSC